MVVNCTFEKEIQDSTWLLLFLQVSEARPAIPFL